ncbi:MAG: hypothetical protein ACR2QZ_10460 [Woeseiaceae bacterium]
MTQEQLRTPASPCEKSINALFGASIADEERIVGVLDEAIPLQGASHADAVEYTVEIPMRYAECFALLSDGSKVALRNPRQFVGWSTHDLNRSLLFRSDGKHYEVVVEAELRGQSSGCIRTIFPESRSGRRASHARKFIGTDGDLVMLPVLPAAI